MARKVIECRSLGPDPQCTLLFVGEADQVVRAYRDHAATVHRYAQGEPATEAALQSAVFVGRTRAYVGDTFDGITAGAIQVPGPGFVIRRFAEGTPEDGAGVTVTLDCGCLVGSGSCTMTIHGGTAKCTNNTCTNCEWVVTVPSASIVEPTILKADWLLDPDKAVT